MNILSAQVGIDVSKSWLDVSIDGARSFRIENTLSACLELVQRLPKNSCIHLESSGGYERIAVRALRSAGLSASVHDPLKVRRLAQATVAKAKTDALDAQSLAKGGPLLGSLPQKSVEREGLCDCSRAISETRAEAAKFRVRAKACNLDSQAKAAYLRCATALAEEADSLEAAFLKRVEESSLKDRFELAMSIPGVGRTLARVCVCELAEDLSQIGTAQACAYAGLAPIDHSSGTWRGKSRLGRGNARLKGACYMPAISAIRSQPWAKELYTKLRAKGRTHQQAIVAVMRRILVRLVAVLKRGSPWKSEPHKT